MQHIIAKPINAAARRLKANDPVSESDDLAPHSFADLKARGFIKSCDVQAPASAPLTPPAPLGGKRVSSPLARDSD